MKYYSLVLNSWIDESNLISRIIYPKDMLIPGLTNKNGQNYLFNETTNEFLKSSTRIKYACEICSIEIETDYNGYKKKKNHFCMKCAQKIVSNSEQTKQKKSQAVKNRSVEVKNKQRLKMKDPEINRKRIEKFKKSVQEQSEERRKQIRESKRNTWNLKTDEELLEIMDKQMKGGFRWKTIHTKLGTIRTQGFEHLAVFKYIELGATKIRRGPVIHLENGRRHFPDLYIEINNKKLIVEVKSTFLYKKYEKSILYSKEQTLKQKNTLNIDDYIIEIF